MLVKYIFRFFLPHRIEHIHVAKLPDSLQALPVDGAPYLDLSVVLTSSEQKPPELVVRVLTQMVVAEHQSSHRSSLVGPEVMQTSARRRLQCGLIDTGKCTSLCPSLEHIALKFNNWIELHKSNPRLDFLD